MGYIDDSVMLGVSDGEDTENSIAGLEVQLVALEDRIRELPANANSVDRAYLDLQMARVKVGLDQKPEAWSLARNAFDVFLQANEWERAVEACDLMFLSEQEGSLNALGQGIWLGVTYPIDPELTLAMLQHVIEETPDDADGAAVAAATSLYIVHLRAEGKQKEDLEFFANQMLGSVARRHSDVGSQAQFEHWIHKLELDNPEAFLVRLRNVVDVLVQDDWWFDRDELRERLPVN